MAGKGNNFTTPPPVKRCHFIGLGITSMNEIFPDDMSPPVPVFLRRNARRRSVIESMAGKGSNSTTPPLKRYRRRLGIVNEILPDDILELILCCLPCQSALTCKLVCKHWLSLISTPSFISSSISRQMIKQQHDDDDDDEEKYDPMILKTYGKYLFLTSQLLKADISFSFLPCGTMSESDKRLAKVEMKVLGAEGLRGYSRSASDDKYEITILASSDDLILCTIWPTVEDRMYICNPFTKESFELPLPPLSDTFSPVDNHIFGFTHKPYYHPVEEEEEEEEEEQRRVVVNSTCSFRVVKLRLITDPENFKLRRASEFEVDIFSSETWQWTTSIMQHSAHPNRPHSSISRNGLLYWLCSHGQVIIHDPYNNKVCCVAELRPPPPQGHGSSCCYNFCVSQGSLLAIDKYSNVVSVWELEDEDQQPKWRSVTISVDFYFCNWKPIAVHPNDRNIIYCWSSSGGIATLSLRTGKFKHTFVQELVTTVNCKSYEVRRFKVDAHKIVVLKAPCWPTRISSLLKSRRLPPL